MKSGIIYKQGDIVLTPFPFTDLTAAKKRPVLFLSNDNYNLACDDFVTCGITTNLSDASYSVLIDARDLAEGFLPQQSRIKVDKIFTLEQGLAIKKLGRVQASVLKKVKEELQKLL